MVIFFFKEMMRSQVLDLKKSGGCDGNVKYKSGQEGIFKFLRCLVVSRLLNDPNRFTFDFMLAKFVRSLNC